MSDAGRTDATITLSGLRVTASIGAFDSERAVPQRLRLDCVVRYDAAAAARNDRLSDAVDYGAIAETLRAVMGARPRRLLECAAAECADAVLAEYPEVRTVRIAISKREIPGGVEQTTVSLERVQSDGRLGTG